MFLVLALTGLLVLIAIKILDVINPPGDRDEEEAEATKERYRKFIYDTYSIPPYVPPPDEEP